MTPADFLDWYLGAALPLWWRAGADPRGGFHEALYHNGQPVLAPRRLRVQARQTAVYAGAAALGWDGPADAACAHGLDFMLAKYRRGDGLFRTLVDVDGAMIDDTATLYDQAFALYALAEAARALPGRRTELEAIAHEARAALPRHAAGGFIETGPRPFQSNPHMHMLEAALAWEAVSDDPAWAALADGIAVLAMERFIDPQGFLREFFASDWRPAEGPDGRIVEPGHQFEWAWLLDRYAAARGGPEGARAGVAAAVLYDIAAAHGVEPRRGVAINALDDSLQLLDPVARLWPQTERIKAAAVFAPGEVPAAVTGLGVYLDTPVRGLWRDRLTPYEGFVEEPAPASSLYHIGLAAAVVAKA
jgi:mannose-6-phosphate isomerase